MSQENVEAVRSMYAAFSRIAQGGDLPSYVAAHYDPDCEYEPTEEEDTIRGYEALIRWNERWFEVWDEFRAEIDEIIETDEAVVTGITLHGRGRKSGMEIEQRIFHVCELRDKRIL